MLTVNEVEQREAEALPENGKAVLFIEPEAVSFDSIILRSGMKVAVNGQRVILGGVMAQGETEVVIGFVIE